MKYSISHIADQLKVARKQKKLTQRALSVKSHIPQSHISKIENGKVDLHVSGLIELSRILGLELMLVPESLVPVFLALQEKSGKKSHRQTPMYRLDHMGTEEDNEDV